MFQYLSSIWRNPALLLACALIGISLSPAEGAKVHMKKVSFSQLPGWQKDQQQDAFQTFLVSCSKIARTKSSLAPACVAAVKIAEQPDEATARAFFETWFAPHLVRAPKSQEKRLTGYYEPEILGSRIKNDRFKIPIYRRPPDLVTRLKKSVRKGQLKGLIAARKTPTGLEPYPTREQIDKGALAGLGLELLYLESEIDTFFLHIQGSGRIRLTDGQTIRVGFHAKNGYPYTSIGKWMIANKQVPPGGMSLDVVKAYLREDLQRARHIMWQNKSFIFFRELPQKNNHQSGPIGAMNIPLTPGRSLAVDKSYHKLGTPIYINAPTIRHHGKEGFQRLMIAQDVGSAIKGAERGDIFWGSGAQAGDIAGNTGHKGEMFVLLPVSSQK